MSTCRIKLLCDDALSKSIYIPFEFYSIFFFHTFKCVSVCVGLKEGPVHDTVFFFLSSKKFQENQHLHKRTQIRQMEQWKTCYLISLSLYIYSSLHMREKKQRRWQQQQCASLWSFKKYISSSEQRIKNDSMELVCFRRAKVQQHFVVHVVIDKIIPGLISAII